MALQGVPLFIANDNAEHGGPVSRALTYAAYRGIEGVLGSTDFRVQSTATPGGSVDILPGVYNALARGPAQDLQSYSGAALTTTNLTIPSNDTSSTRSDLIYISVEDPNDGTGQWSTPSDPVNGPYEFIRREGDVGSSVTSIHELSGSIGIRNAVDLCRLDIPANTGSFDEGDTTFVDLRKLAAPLSDSDDIITYANSGSTLSSGSNYQLWPAEASWSIPAPPWANRVSLVAWFTPQMHGNAWGSLRFTVDGNAGAATSFDDNYVDPGGAGGMRIPLMVASNHDISSSQQGSNIVVEIQGQQNSSTGGGLNVGDLVAGRGTTIVFQYTFKQELA